MKLFTASSFLLATTTVLIIVVVPQSTHALSLDEALLTDLVPDDGTGSSCTPTPGTSSTTFTFPGQQPNTWKSEFEQYESDMFLAQLSHTDATNPNRSWIMRFAESGSMYSFNSPNTYGEAMPPQNRGASPWIDEVHQSVSVDQQLNFPPDSRYFIHQAGVYQHDSPYTDTPFFSPNVAKFCDADSGQCTFATWGQHAHVPTTYSSKTLYIHRYRNCGDGVVEYTQTIQNFAPTGEANQDLSYFNVPWSGVRPSSLPDVLEPNPTTSELELDPSNGDVRVQAYQWGTDEEIESIKNFDQTAGYTTFASGIWPNQTAIPYDMPCRKPNGDCYNGEYENSPDHCMVDSCTDDQIAQDGYVRMELKVPSGGTACFRHGASTPDSVLLGCQLHGPGFGRRWQDPVGDYVLTNPATGGQIRFTQFYHLSWDPNNGYTFFHTGYPDDGTWDSQGSLKDQIESTFPGDADIVASTYVEPEPESYDPTTLPSLTFVFGKGEEYASGGTVTGTGRRRIGTTTRDFTVFTNNHYQTRVEPGETYVTRQFLVNSELGSVESTANQLVDETMMDEIDEHEYNGRAVQLYTNENDEPGVFGAAASDAVGGTTTNCGQGTVTCSGSSTPGVGFRPFFFIECGSSKYFGQDQYYFMPGRNHTEDIFHHDGTVRAYACDGEDATVRPSFKLVGYFDPADAGCTSLVGDAYDETFCDRTAGPTSVPTTSPTTSMMPTSSPTETPIPMALPCIKPGGDCSNNANPNDPANCMVGSCTDDQVANDGYIRLDLVVQTYTPGALCSRHGHSANIGKLLLGCNFHSGIYGRTWPGPISNYKFTNLATGGQLHLTRTWHWTWDTPNKNTFFVTDIDDTADAAELAAIFAGIEADFPAGSAIKATYA